MDLARKLELLNQKIEMANNGSPEDFSLWHKQTGTVLRTVMGAESHSYRDFSAIRYTPAVRSPDMRTDGYRAAGVRNVVNVLKAAKEELQLQEETSATPNQEAPTQASADEIFIVHGRDNERKLDFARTIRAITGVEPIILHEQPNRGRVLIEKFEANASRAGYAVVLLTADDLGRAKTDAADVPRARQNVVFELGFFIGALGRERVAVFLDSGVEEPGDVRGIVYNPIDSGGAWKLALARELDAADIPVDFSGLR